MLRFIYRHKYEFIILIFGFFYTLFFSRYGLDVEDEGWFLYASKLISQGLMPYRDFSLHTTPGSLYAQAFMFKLFGVTVMTGRYSMIFLGLFTALMLFYISKELVGSQLIASISGIFFIFWGISHIRYPWYGWYALLFGVTVPYFILKYLKSGKRIFLFFAGGMCSATFLMKQNLGVAVISASLSLIIIKNILLGMSLRQNALIRFIKEGAIACSGIVVPLALTAVYFYLNNALNPMMYYIFKHASHAAFNRFIFIPFPHIKDASIAIFFIYLVFCYFLYASIWEKRKMACAILAGLIFISFAAIFFLFMKDIESIDSIYALDHLKAGFINGFFNLCMASVIFGGFIFLKQYLQKKVLGYKNLALLFVTLWALFYIWFSLCISRDHLHMVLGMAPAYALIPFLLEGISDKLFYLIKNKAQDDRMAMQYTRLVMVFLPFLCICFIGYFSALKNEGLRSIFPPVTKMDSMLDINNARGIIVSRHDKDIIKGLVGYISENTSKDEKIFDVFKDTLFYFLSGRNRSSYHLVMTSDVMRPDEQEGIINSLKKDNVGLIIAQKDQWDNAGWYMNPEFNPLTSKIWGYVVNNYEKKKDFGKYYILTKSR